MKFRPGHPHHRHPVRPHQNALPQHRRVAVEAPFPETVADHGHSAIRSAARELDPRARDESHLPGAREGHLTELFTDAGLASVEETSIEATVGFETFDEWWEPFTLGVGPAGAYVERLDAAQVVRLREACRTRAAAAPFIVSARAWAARGLAKST